MTQYENAKRISAFAQNDLMLRRFGSHSEFVSKWFKFRWLYLMEWLVLFSKYFLYVISIQLRLEMLQRQKLA